MDMGTQYKGNISDDVVIVYKTGLIQLQKHAAISQNLQLLLQGKEKELIKQSNKIKLLEQHIKKLVEQNTSTYASKPGTIDADSGICSTKSFSKSEPQSLSSCVVEDGDGILVSRSPHINVPAPTKVNKNQDFQLTKDYVGDVDQTTNVEQKHLKTDRSQCHLKNDGKLNSMAELWAFNSCASEQNFTSVVKELKKTKQLLCETLQKNNENLQDAMVSTNLKEAVKSLESENMKLKSQIEELQLFKNMLRKEQEGVSVLSPGDSSSKQTSITGSFELENQVTSTGSSSKVQTSTDAQRDDTKKNEQYSLNDVHERQKNGQRQIPSNVTPEVSHIEKEKHLQDEINSLKVTCQKLIQKNQGLLKQNKNLQTSYEGLLLTNEKMEQQHQTEKSKMEEINKDLFPYIEKLRNNLETAKEKISKLEEELILVKGRQQQLLYVKTSDENKEREGYPAYQPQPRSTMSAPTATYTSGYHRNPRHSGYSPMSTNATSDEYECAVVDHGQNNSTCERCYAEFTNYHEFLDHISKCLD